MTPERFNAFCASLPHSAHAVQWGGRQGGHPRNP